MDKIFQPFLNLVKDIQPFTGGMIGIVLVIGGCLIFFGGEKGIKIVKDNAKWVLIATLCILGANYIATYVTCKFTF